MKKLICVVIMLLLLSCLTACNLTKKLTGALADQAKATPKVEEMMKALTEDRLSDAKALMHPEVDEEAEQAIAQMNVYLSGREVISLEATSVTFNQSFGPSGDAERELALYKVTLTDGVVVAVDVVYLSDDQGTGFSSFQLVLGVI